MRLEALDAIFWQVDRDDDHCLNEHGRVLVLGADIIFVVIRLGVATKGGGGRTNFFLYKKNSKARMRNFGA